MPGGCILFAAGTLVSASDGFKTFSPAQPPMLALHATALRAAGAASNMNFFNDAKLCRGLILAFAAALLLGLPLNADNVSPTRPGYYRFLTGQGIASAAEIGVHGPEGKWLIEGHGVDPDVVVDNPPHATFTGSDAQLDAAIKYLQDESQKDPRPVPPAPPYPVKAFKFDQ